MDICHQNDIFLIFDECQTGFGRTGSWFFYQQLDCIPDFLVCAKAMGLGFPVSCVIANGNSINNESFEMMYYSSHQNEPFSARVVSFAVDFIEEKQIIKSNLERGEYFLSELKKLSSKYKIIESPRGKGLMCGFNLYADKITDYKNFGENFCKIALKEGIMLQHCNNGRTIRLLPNYIIEKNDIDFFVSKLDNMLDKYYPERM